jgi:hypothetical protein
MIYQRDSFTFHPITLFYLSTQYITLILPTRLDGRARLGEA